MCNLFLGAFEFLEFLEQLDSYGRNWYIMRRMISGARLSGARLQLGEIELRASKSRGLAPLVSTVFFSPPAQLVWQEQCLISEAALHPIARRFAAGGEGCAGVRV